MSDIRKISLAEKFGDISQPWDPKIIGALNDQHVKIAKFKGEFIEHTHANEDELFLVIKGSISIALEDQTIELGAGEMAVIPRGVPHKPMAREEAHVLMFEPAATRNTGAITNELTKENPDWL